MKAYWRLTVISIPVITVILIGCQTMYLQPDTSTQDFLDSGVTSSFFRAIQVDPKSEDAAGPQFVSAADFNGDGRLDLVSGWNESQPVVVHIQQRDEDNNIIFATIPIGGTTPIARIAGLETADVDQDGRTDIIVLVKDMGIVATCDQARPDCDPTDNNGVIDGAVMGEIVMFFCPPDPLAEPWEGVEVVSSFLAGTEVDSTAPEDGSYTALTVGDVDGINGPDLVVAFNAAEGDPELKSIDLYANPGGAASRDPGAWFRTMIGYDLPAVKDAKLLDVDRDNDLDVVCTYPESKSLNVRWLINPLEVVNNPADILVDWGAPAPIGQVATNADRITTGDIDNDGNTDVMVRSSIGKIVQWFKCPDFPSYTYVRNPWQVYTIAEFTTREPQAIALGDLTNDNQLDAVISAEGALAWFDSDEASSVYDNWGEHIIIDDSPEADSNGNVGTNGVTSLAALLDPQGQQEAASSSFINWVLIVDIDGDGDNDIIGTLDRQGLSGLSSDALVLFQNTLIR